jgi:hypothetical protein
LLIRQSGRPTIARLMAALDARAPHPARLNASDYADALDVIVSEHGAAQGIVEGDPKTQLKYKGYLATSDPDFAVSSGPALRPKSLMQGPPGGRFLRASSRAGGSFEGGADAGHEPGEEAVVSQVPAPLVEALRLTCRGLLVVMPP